MKVNRQAIFFSFILLFCSFFVEKIQGENRAINKKNIVAFQDEKNDLSWLSLEGSDIQLGDEDIEEDDNYLHPGSVFSNWSNRVNFYKQNDPQSKKIVHRSKLPLYLLYLQLKVFS